LIGERSSSGIAALKPLPSVRKHQGPIPVDILLDAPLAFLIPQVGIPP
jgi:hypothetical protein